MPTPDYILELRKDLGQKELFLPGVTAVTLRRRDPSGQELPTPEVLLVRRADDGNWSSVAGILEPGEEPGIAAAREVLEETGVTAEPVRVTGVSDHGRVEYPNGDRCAFLDVSFELEFVSGEPYVGDDESMDAGFFPVDDLPQPFLEKHRERIEWALDSGAPARFRT